jgi:hypothetical protein
LRINRHGTDDKRHFEGFRFSADGKPISPNDEPFFSDSDVVFGEFKKAIKKQWYAYQLEKISRTRMQTMNQVAHTNTNFLVLCI